MPPAITRLRRLARLHVVGTLEGNIVELPPGFGTLRELSYLRFEGVSFVHRNFLRRGQLCICRVVRSDLIA